jgi:hypothetical protein
MLLGADLARSDDTDTETAHVRHSRDKFVMDL